MSNLIKAADVAEKIKVTKDHVYQMVATHRIPFIRIGGAIRFSPEEIDSWIDSQKVAVKK